MNKGREDKNPWDKWFWQDYDSDPALRACSFAAQGLWMRMLCIMAKSKRKGYLLDNESKMESKTLAKIVGGSEDEINPLLDELEKHGVYSKTIDGIIFNRRMVRQSELSVKRSMAGKLGGRPKKQNESKMESKTKTPSASASASASEYVSEYDKKEECKEGKEELENVRFNRWVEEMMIKWNQFAKTHGLAEIKGVIKGSTRERHLRARFNEPSFDMEKILEKISKSDFLLGIKTDWKVNFDWVICPSNYIKILEGNYDNKESSQEIDPLSGESDGERMMREWKEGFENARKRKISPNH